MSIEPQKQNPIAEFFSLVMDERVSLMSKIVILSAAVVYFASPVDIISEAFLGPFGYVDDVGLVIAAFKAFTRQAHRQIENWDLMSDAEKAARLNNSLGSILLRLTQSCLFLLGFLLLLVFLGTTISLLGGIYTTNQVISSISNFFGQPASATVVSSRTLLNSLQPLGQLVTISADVAQADIKVSVHSGGINLCGHSANHVAQGVIEAGVDIMNVTEDNISYDAVSNTYTLNLPTPVITSCRMEYIRQYERSGGGVACPVDWDNIRLLAQYEAMRLFAADTLEAGILTRAERETTLLMQSFVGALVGSQVRVIYTEPETDAKLPSSCQPQLPNGWAFNEELNSWTKVE